MMTLLLLLFISFNPLQAMDNQGILTNKLDKEKKALTCNQMYDLLTQHNAKTSAFESDKAKSIKRQIPDALFRKFLENHDAKKTLTNLLTALNEECKNYLYEVMDPMDGPFPLLKTESYYRQEAERRRIDNCASCKKWVTSEYDPETTKGVLERWPVICGTCRNVPPLNVEYRKYNFTKKYGLDVSDFKVGTHPQLYVQHFLDNQEDI